MAVDIKQLRIGSHVEVDGVRRAVFGLGCGRVSFLPHPTSSVTFSVLASEIEPILITPELLVELGFEKDGDTFVMREKTESDNILSRTYIGVTMICGMHFRIEACDAVTVCGNLIVSYLHELESFIYLTLGKELIEE